MTLTAASHIGRRKGNHVVSSTVCRYEHFTTDWYREWAQILFCPQTCSLDAPSGYRKTWEWAAILEVLRTHGMLAEGKRGLGFAVGRERLPSIMASHGVQVVATDLDVNASKSHWVEQGQHSAGANQLFYEENVARAEFDRLVRFQPADMNAIEGLDEESFDFLWSSCAFEHLGSIEAGLDFVKNAMKLLKPGGIAIHTTEYNVSSNNETESNEYNSIYRRQDIERLAFDLRHLDCGMEPMDFDAGYHQFDLLYDKEPYFQPGRIHIKLTLYGYICTSALLVVHKG